MKYLVARLMHWFVRVILRRRPHSIPTSDPWEDQRRRSLWVGIADAARRGR